MCLRCNILGIPRCARTKPKCYPSWVALQTEMGCCKTMNTCTLQQGVGVACMYARAGACQHLAQDK